MTLGKKYKAISDEINRVRAEREEFEARKRNQIKQENLETVIKFFAKTKESIAQHVNNGTMLTETIIPDFKGPNNELYFDHTRRIDHPDNPYNDVWLEFKQWASYEDLVVAVEKRHDGVGEKSWIVLTIKSVFD